MVPAAPFSLPPITLASEAETARLAADLARGLRPGDTVLLSGPIGAGKSFFARAAIRALCGPQTEVPSPSFTLVQCYDSPAGEIWHCDLYRLGDPQEVIELGLDQAFESAICLIEWPDRLGDLAPPQALHLALSAGETAGAAHRLRVADPSGAWRDRAQPFVRAGARP